MKLYTYSGAPNPRRVHIYLAEKGIEIPFETVDIMKRENRSPEFVAEKNAMGGVPVLELDDGSHIAEHFQGTADVRVLDESELEAFVSRWFWVRRPSRPHLPIQEQYRLLR